MRLSTGVILVSALAVHDTVGQATTTSAASLSSTTPVCGQDFTDSAGTVYDISCGQTYSGNVLQSKRRRTDWSLERRNLKNTGASETSFQNCIESCDNVASCIAASFVSGQCTLLSSVTDIVNADGAQAALHAVQAATLLPSLGLSIVSSMMSTQTKSLLPPNATTTKLSYASEVAAHLSQRLSENSPTITGADTKVYIDTDPTGSPSSSTGSGFPSVSITTTDSPVKRAASTCTASNVASNIAVVKKNEASPVPFCENWNAAKPHASSPFSAIALPKGVSTACDCILAAYASSTTCAATGVQSNMAVVIANKPTPTAFCQNWIAAMPHSSSPFTAIKLALGVTNACKCLLAGASSSYSLSSSSSSSSAPSSASSSVSTPSSSSIVTTSTGAYVKNVGKRGLGYNAANLTQPFSRAGQNSQVSWGYNWYLAENTGNFNPALEYIPMLWNNDPTLLSQWPTAAQIAINNGATALMSMNEPDWCTSGGSCMNVSTVVSTYQKYMQPFAGKALLGAPAVTNAGSPYGLTYLQNFLDTCTGCTVDYINLHWYSNKYAGATYFESYINSARKVANGRPIWITEFGLDSTYSYTDAELQAFLEQVMPWLDQQTDVHRYAYFMASDGILLSSDGSGMSGTGAVYNSYTNTSVQANLY